MSQLPATAAPGPLLASCSLLDPERTRTHVADILIYFDTQE